MDSDSPGLIWQFGNCDLDETSLLLKVAGELVELERKPLEVLRHLLRHAGEVVTKEELHASVWPGRVLSETVLTKAISRLREVLADPRQEIIKTAHGYGYRLVAAVSVRVSANPIRPQLGLKAGDTPPQRLQWRLVEHLSTGGRGEIWRVAHSKTNEARVFKFALDSDALEAIKREITLYRLLRTQLPAPVPVAAILDWNLEDPPYFIESSFYPAGNMADWIASSGGFAAVSVAQRLEVFVKITEAVAQVHAVGVLHKDLKPGNVLMSAAEDGQMVPLLADFGSGAVISTEILGRAGITQMGFGHSLGAGSQATPLYAAPELLQGQPHTIQSDIYALGVMLYQMMAGDFGKPLALGWEKDVSDELLRQDIAASVQGAPEGRISSAQELATRVRHLSNRHSALKAEREAEAAHQHSLQASQRAHADNLRLRTRRNYLLVVMAVFGVGLAATLFGFWQARVAAQQAQKNAASAEAVTAFLTTDLLGAMDVGKLTGEDVRMPQVLDYAASKLNARFAQDSAGRARAWVAVMAAYRRFPTKSREELMPLWRDHYSALSKYLAESPALALPLVFQVIQDQPELDYLPEHRALTEQLMAYLDTEPEASPVRRLQVRLIHASLLMLGGDWKAAASAYKNQEAELRKYSSALVADAVWPLATAVRDAAILQEFDLAKSGCAQLRSYGLHYGPTLSLPSQVDLLFGCGAYQSYAGNFAQLLIDAEAGQKLASTFLAEDSGERQTFQHWHANALAGLGRPQEALVLFTESVTSRERTKAGVYLGSSLVSRASVYEQLGQYDLALADAERAIRIFDGRPPHPRGIAAGALYARLLAHQGNPKAAASELARLSTLLIAQMPPQHRTLAELERAQGWIDLRHGNYGLARSHFETAQRWLAAAFGPQHKYTQEASNDLKQLAQTQGQTPGSP